MNGVLRDIEFSCDKCGHRLVVDEKYAGMSVDCPKCQANLSVPYKFQCSECSFKSYRDFPRCSRCGSIGPGPLGDLVRKEKETFSDFFAFRIMISSILARIIYLLGAIGITIVGFVIMFIRDFEKVENLTDIERLIGGLGIIVVGNLVWRIACEIWGIIFSIHDRLVSIERSLKQK